MAEALLELEDVSGGYGRMRVLDGLSMRVAPGRLTTVIGPNGAGKSTVFKAVFGLASVFSGKIRFAGEDITGLQPRALLDRGIVYVPQGRNLFSELTVRHNLELGGVTLRDPQRLDERIGAMFARFPVLREKADRQAGTLSGGEQKMLEIARGLLLEPRLVLVDEPSIGLSPLLVGQVFQILRDLVGGGVAVLMVEQNARRALEISDDAVVLEQGRQRLAGPAAEILANPELGALFLGGTTAS
ncbi:ABC transporter ATP-binding protein [Geminicoccaceae bacterium 1502E]|nr:ABC transporter ATP-binding protein [Geminicoccaceae bacterium 1502E]